MHALFLAGDERHESSCRCGGLLAKSLCVPKQNPIPWPKLLVLVIMVTVAIFAWRQMSREQLLALIERGRSMGAMGYVAFVLGYALWAAIGLPPSILSLGAAAAFGFWPGLTVVLVAADLGALIGFLLARHVARDWFTEVVGKRMAVAQINRAVAESGWRIVMLTRLPPVSPFSIVNYAYGLTAVSLKDYMLGTAIGIIPGTAAYIYLGTILGDVARRGHRERTPLEWGLYICGFIATVIVCVYIMRLAKAALARHAIKE